MKNDQFADIAAGGVNTENKGLDNIVPPAMDYPELELQKGIKSMEFPEKMDSKEELYQELEKQKEYYRQYLRKLAPAMEPLRHRIKLDRFDWRIAEPKDKLSFSRVITGEGSWEQVEIPHYGGPLGSQTTYYRTIFHAEKQEGKALFLHFDGVDYLANVFVNGSLAGSHEGFFAAFEFDITDYVVNGENILVVEVVNDFVQKRNEEKYRGEMLGGDKIYAATGPGYDDPLLGWHHCPPGMGIYQGVYLEMRSRCFIRDSFVRPLTDTEQAELWLEIYKCDSGYEDLTIQYSLYGRNFEEVVFEGKTYTPFTGCEIGLGDTFTKASLTANGQINQPVKIYMEKGINYLKIPIDLPDARTWTPQSPYLYELQIYLVEKNGTITDNKNQSFGMRSFTMDTDTVPKGTFYLNGEKIRLRGANTMGHEQQCVMKGDFDQLLDDLLLAKICNMNFLRLTQRPVQEEVYDYCDMVGLMTQTDLPLFGVLRRNQFTEALRQTEEMEKLVRRHPCNILVSYINEPFPNAYNQPHRHLGRKELMNFFDCADMIVKMNNPERVIKHVDGDYDPPSKTLPDNHCYTCWYNGHGVDAGALHKGYWIPIKHGWNCGCGEFGTEGLDYEAVMRKYYPSSWLPGNQEEERSWSAGSICGSQTGNFHYFFFDTPDSLKGWIEASQEHQAWAAKWMTEAFRRNARMVSIAIHLFIDAFPAGWMKTIMDVDRNPKPAYFAYRDALTPVMVSLRTDRFTCFAGETVPVELWICNDTPANLEGYRCSYEILDENQEVLAQGSTPAEAGASDSQCMGRIPVRTKKASGKALVRAAVQNKEGVILHTNQVEITVYEDNGFHTGRQVIVPGVDGNAFRLLKDLGIDPVPLENAGMESIILVDDYNEYLNYKEEIDLIVQKGGRLIFLELEPGTYQAAGREFTVKNSAMLPMNFVSNATGHPMAQGFGKKAFWNWYDKEADMITPILSSTVSGAGMRPILTSGNTDENGNWQTAPAVVEAACQYGMVVVCQLKLSGRTKENPVAKLFFEKLMQ